MSVAVKQIKIFREKLLNTTLVQQIFIKCLVIPGNMVFARSMEKKKIPSFCLQVSLEFRGDGFIR